MTDTFSISLPNLKFVSITFIMFKVNYRVKTQVCKQDFLNNYNRFPIETYDLAP